MKKNQAAAATVMVLSFNVCVGICHWQCLRPGFGSVFGFSPAVQPSGAGLIHWSLGFGTGHILSFTGPGVLGSLHPEKEITMKKHFEKHIKKI